MCSYFLSPKICWQISGLFFSEPEDLGHHLFSPQGAWISFLHVKTEARMVYREEEGQFGGYPGTESTKYSTKDEKVLMCGILSRADYGPLVR